MNSSVLVTGAFDDLKARGIRFLDEASRLGALTVRLWSDALVRERTGAYPKFPAAERHYFVSNLRFVSHVELVETPLPPTAAPPQSFAVEASQANAAVKKFCAQNQIPLHEISTAQLAGFPAPPLRPFTAGRKKVIVTGCYDWFHSGHVRFFEEVSAHGDLIVCVGHDANIRLLKGEGRYLVGATKFVAQAHICTGDGWVDAEPEILRLKPDIYAVNEDGDKGGKREYCAKMGLEYLVLQRAPAPGLPKRSSTDLRGF
jgi:cytidyltransferase-like protein